MEQQTLLHSITPEQLRVMILEVVQEAIQQTTSTNSEPDIPELVSRKQAKELLGFSFPTLRKFDVDGTLPAVRIGSKVFYLRIDILNALKSTKVTSL